MKHKGKKIAKKRKPAAGAVASAPREVLEPVSGNPGKPRVIRSQSAAPKPMTVDEAVEEVSQSKSEFLVFWDSESERVSILYRRKDGNFGLIES